MWGSLIQAGVGLAAAIASKPHAQVQQYDVKQYAAKNFSYSTAPVPDNSTSVFNRAYSKAVQRMNSLEVMYKGERDITAAKLKGVKERLAIGLTQDEAEANIRLNAAVAGVGGGSVSDSIYQTHANAAFKVGDQATNETNGIELGKAAVFKGHSGSNVMDDDYTVEAQFTGGDYVSQGVSGAPVDRAIPDDNWSMTGAIMDSLSHFDNQFFKDLGLGLEAGGNYSSGFGDRTSVPGGMGGV